MSKWTINRVATIAIKAGNTSLSLSIHFLHSLVERDIHFRPDISGLGGGCCWGRKRWELTEWDSNDSSSSICPGWIWLCPLRSIYQQHYQSLVSRLAHPGTGRNGRYGRVHIQFALIQNDIIISRISLEVTFSHFDVPWSLHPLKCEQSRWIGERDCLRPAQSV